MTLVNKPVIVLLPDGRRLHCQHGPIDLIVEASGEKCEVNTAYAQMANAFEDVLTELVAELDILRQPVSSKINILQGTVAKQMYAAAVEYSDDCFVTPMAGVAGAVADHMLHMLTSGRELHKAYVNNGGDIALYLTPGASFDIAVCDNPLTDQIASSVRLTEEKGIGGIATSGWRGRSHSLGIADAVTVLAKNSVHADIAATLIANEVDLPGSELITRLPAIDLDPDSDLGKRLVTVEVDKLASPDIQKALFAGETAARKLLERGLVEAVFISVQGKIVSVGNHDAISALPNHLLDEKCLKTGESLHA